jgi:hypothetical protein
LVKEVALGLEVAWFAVAVALRAFGVLSPAALTGTKGSSEGLGQTMQDGVFLAEVFDMLADSSDLRVSPRLLGHVAFLDHVHVHRLCVEQGPKPLLDVHTCTRIGERGELTGTGVGCQQVFQNHLTVHQASSQ